MVCLVKTAKELIDKGQYELATKVLSLMETNGESLNKLLNLFNNLVVSGYDLNRLMTFNELVLISISVPTVNETLDKEVYALEDFFPNINLEAVSNDLKLTVEDEMVLVTFGWAKKELCTAYVIKHSRRISDTFNLYNDPRWVEQYKNGKVKMRAVIAGIICKFKNKDILDTSYKSGNNVFYTLSRKGDDLAAEVARKYNFSLEKTF